MNIRLMPRLLALLAFVVWVLILFPHPYTVILGGSIACLSLPVYQWFREHMGILASLACYFSMLVSCLVLPFAFVSVLVAPQAVTGYRTILRWSSSGFEFPPIIQEYVTIIYSYLMKIPGFSEWATELNTEIQSILSTVAKTVLSGGINIAGSTMSILWQTMLMVVLAGLGVAYAPTLYKLSLRITALPEESLDRLILTTRSALRSVFVGIVFISMIQGFLCAIGFMIFGITESAFWGLISTFCAVIPVIGSALVWIPLSIVLWVQGAPWHALGLVAWGAIIVAGADSLMRPVFLKKGINTSVIVLFLSIICSMAAFGVIGLVLGPVLVAIGVQALHESDYLLQKEQKEKEERSEVEKSEGDKGKEKSENPSSPA